MPLYDYECSQCGRVTEVRHGFGETYAEPCAHCGGALRRVFNPAPIVFKGSGFYVTDSRRKTESAAAEKRPADKPAESSASKPAESSASKPASADSTNSSKSEPAA